FIGYTEEQVHSDLVKQLMKDILTRTRKRDSEIEIWDLDLLLDYISKLALAPDQGDLKPERIMAISSDIHNGLEIR
ncbi:MAG: hypothetical protein EZS28_055651, partial [Streblomastix strix]